MNRFTSRHFLIAGFAIASSVSVAVLMLMAVTLTGPADDPTGDEVTALSTSSTPSRTTTTSTNASSAAAPEAGPDTGPQSVPLTPTTADTTADPTSAEDDRVEGASMHALRVVLTGRWTGRAATSGEGSAALTQTNGTAEPAPTARRSTAGTVHVPNATPQPRVLAITAPTSPAPTPAAVDSDDEDRDDDRGGRDDRRSERPRSSTQSEREPESDRQSESESTPEPEDTPEPEETPEPDDTPEPERAPEPRRESTDGCEAVSGSRLALLDDRVGFGRNASGGADGCIYRVTNLDNSGDGSLREGAEQSGRWVIFDVSGTVDLSSDIDVGDDTTIDGRGAEVTIEGGGLYMLERENVIISHVELRDVRDDAIQIRRTSARDIWINHVTISEVPDGYIDITQGATNVTVSWSRFDRSPGQERDKVMLIGANDPGDPDDNSRVTIHHNLFNGTQQRNPLLRAGFVHSFNNYLKGWGLYGSGVAEEGRLLSENNVYQYTGSAQERAFTPWDDGRAYISSNGDVFMDGASGEETGSGSVDEPPYSYSTESTSGLAGKVEGRAGVQQVSMSD